MTPFEQYLISLGYKQYRNGQPARLNDYHYSTMEPGGISYEYIKDGVTITFGLHEKGKPPTLVWPRPNGCYWDDDMNRMLKEKTPEEIYNLLPL